MNTDPQENSPPPGFDEPRVSRMGQIKIIFLTILVMLFGFFLWMNFTPATVWVFGWTITIPLILVAAACFLIGAVGGIIAHMIYRRRLEEE